jgi:hypothetical protein
MKPANNPCHRFSVMDRIIDTGDKFISCANDMELGVCKNQFKKGCK